MSAVITTETLGPLTATAIENLGGANLLLTYNELARRLGEKEVSRFSDRITGVKRLKKLIDQLEPVAEKEEESPKGRHGEPAPRKSKRDTSGPLQLAAKPQEAIRRHRPSTRRGKMIDLMAREKGASIEEMAKKTGWSAKEVAITMNLIHSYVGHGIKEVEGRFHLLGSPKTHKPFKRSPKKEIKTHRPGTKRADVVRLLSQTEGATLQEVMVVCGWDERTAIEGVTLVHTYLGYGLREDDDGKIHLVGG